MEKFKILVIDYTAGIIELLRIFLTDGGYEVVATRNVLVAFDIMSTEKIDIILLSIFMPGISGIDVLKILKNDNEKRNIPVILLSSLDENETRKIASETGAEGFLCMPYSKDEVLNKVHEFLLDENKKIIKIVVE